MTPEIEIGNAIERHGRGVLAFSGGKDSLAVLNLCKPYRDRITVVWVNTGVMFPHMVEFVRRTLADWDFEELTSDYDHWTEISGLPADIVPVFNTEAGMVLRSHEPRKMLQSWVECCFRLRQIPINDYMAQWGVPLLFIHGQRRVDQGGFRLQSRPNERMEICAPIRDWSDADVFDYLDRQGIELPEQYPEVIGSLECWNCTAMTGDGRTLEEDAQMMAYMKRRYPHLHDEVQAARKDIRAVIEGAFHNLTAHNYGE